MIKKIEAILADPEDVCFLRYWVPSHGLKDAKKARAEGKVILISWCDCGCWTKELQEKANLLVEETFGNDSLVAFTYSGAEGRRVLLLPKESQLSNYVRAIAI